MGVDGAGMGRGVAVDDDGGGGKCGGGGNGAGGGGWGGAGEGRGEHVKRFIFIGSNRRGVRVEHRRPVVVWLCGALTVATASIWALGHRGGGETGC